MLLQKVWLTKVFLNEDSIVCMEYVVTQMYVCIIIYMYIYTYLYLGQCRQKGAWSHEP